LRQASINTLHPMRDDDIRSDHYLDVANHPTMTYRSTGVTERPAGECWWSAT